MPKQTTNPSDALEPLSSADSPELLGRLMVYLFCIASCAESKIFDDDYITDYKRFASLSMPESRSVLEAAHDLGPQNLSDKIIGDVLEGLDDIFVSTKALNLPYRKKILVLGITREITFKKTLVCSAAWRAKFYENPLEQLSVEVIGTRHCPHCLGNESDDCSCPKCGRFHWSRCRQLCAPSVQGSGALSISTQLHVRDSTRLAHKEGGASQTSSEFQHTPTAYHVPGSAVSTSGDSAPLSSTSEASSLSLLITPTLTSVGERSPTTPRQSQYELSETSDATSDRTETFYQFQAETLSQTTMAIQSSEGSTDSLHPEPMPCIIVVIGPTGSGKSTFISEAIGRNVGVGHTLTSCTKEIELFHVPRDIIREDMEVILVDTPGFDDTNRPDYEIFEKVANWLKTEMKNKHGIAGLIYLHRISDNRMAGTPLKTLNMFRGLCGKKMMTSVVLMTTMWPNDSNLTPQEVQRMQEVQRTTADDPMSELDKREKELGGEYFKEFIRLGATLTRFGNTQTSAAKILEPLVYAWSLKEEEERIYRVVRLQKELINYRLATKQTSAARKVYDTVQSVIEERRNFLDRLDHLVAEASQRDDPDELNKVLQEVDRVINELAAAQKEAAQLDLNFTGRLKIFVSKIQRKFHPVIDIARQRQLARIKCQISWEDMQEGDKVIIVAGVTGSGMSTFISRALGEDVGMRKAVRTVEAGNNNGTVTDHTDGKETPKSWTRAVKFFRSSRSKIVFVDTPGFDNDNQALSDTVIRNKIIHLGENLPTKAKFSGFIFLHNAAKPTCTLDLSKAIDDFPESFRKKFMTAAVVAIFKEKHAEVPADARKSLGKLSIPARVEIFSDNRESAKAVLEKLLNQKPSIIPPNFTTTSASVKHTT